MSDTKHISVGANLLFGSIDVFYSFTNKVEVILSICHYQWDALENKSTVLLYGGGGLVAVWLSSILVGAINSVPLVSHITLAFLSSLIRRFEPI